MAFGAFKVGEATSLFTSATAFHTAPATACSDMPFTMIHMRLGLQPFKIGSHHAPTVKTVHSDDAGDINATALPPIQQNLDDAESTVVLPGTMGRSQRDHHGGHDESMAPLCHFEGDQDQTSDLGTMATQCISFDDTQSHSFPDNVLLLPLMHHQAGFNAHSLIWHASAHLQTPHVQTIFESLPSLDFLPLIRSSGASTLPPHMVFSTGGSPPHAPLSSGTCTICKHKAL